MAIKEDAPNWMLAAFRADGETVRWATGDELAASPMQRAKRMPCGEPAGGKEVHGRGKLVLFSSRQLITSDILLALDLGQFHWTFNGSGPDGDASDQDGAALELVRKTWRLDEDGAVRWLVDAHELYPAGSVAKGVLLSGRRERLFSYKMRGYVESDVKHVLEQGRWPWQPEWD
jgi:hypothetical protein